MRGYTPAAIVAGMYWIGAIIAISVLIIVHEAGHYLVARLCNMRVERFSLGFGPAVLGWQRGETLFQIAPIPFGGFVEIAGMNVAEDVEPGDERAYPNKPAWQRFITIFAGPATNYLFAIVLAFTLFVLAGVPSGTAWYGVGDVNVGYDAVGKLEPHDRIVKIDGEAIYFRYEGADTVSLADVVHKAGDRAVQLELLRDGKPLTVAVTPKFDEENKRYRLGIGLEYQPERVDVGVFGAIGHALWYPIEQTEVIATGLYRVITGKEKGEFAGPVGIADAIKQAIEIGWIAAFQLLMILNVYLGLFNLFPLPALDGGRLVFLSYEMATRRRANPKIEATVHMVGIMALLVLMVLVTYKDCARLF